MLNQNWIFGQASGLDFRTSPPTPTSGFKINTMEGCASVSDARGNLLFYSDGLTIWDAQGIAQVQGLEGDPSSSQSCVVVPDPASSTRFYVLTTDGSSQRTQGKVNHFNGVLVDVANWTPEPPTMRSMLGTDYPSTSDLSPAEKITAIQNEDCTVCWVVVALQQSGDIATQLGAGVLRIFKIDQTGISYHRDFDIQVAGSPRSIRDLGYLRASPDRRTLALANGESQNVLIFAFDVTTGDIDMSQTREVTSATLPEIPDGGIHYPYGAEFSANSQFLYYSTLSWDQRAGNVFQVDLSQPTLSQTFIAQIFTTPQQTVDRMIQAIGALQRGQDGVIYIAREGKKELVAILSPDTAGQGCDLRQGYITWKHDGVCKMGLPNLLPNPCNKASDEHGDCHCGCSGCNEHAEDQNGELGKRAEGKSFVQASADACGEPFGDHCTATALQPDTRLEPCFFFHWGDGKNDQIEEHDTEVFYLTACNPFTDVQFNGLRITRVQLMPNRHPLDKIQIVPDRFVSMDCLEPCSRQTREFALITRANDTAGDYTLEVDYCYDSVTLANASGSGTARFSVVITED